LPHRIVNDLLETRNGMYWVEPKQTLVDRVKTWTGVLPESGNYRILVDGDETGETYKMMIAVQ
jgi:hypothetical protein